MSAQGWIVLLLGAGAGLWLVFRCRRQARCKGGCCGGCGDGGPRRPGGR